MDNTETLDVQLATILENLKKLGENNEQLPSLEKWVQDQICALLDAEAPIKEFFRKLCTLYWPEGMELSGSTVEGAMLARCFQRNEDCNEMEIDIMDTMFTIPQEMSHLLEPVEDKSGFVHLLLCQELCPDVYTWYTEDILGGSKNAPSSLDQTPKYISPLSVRNDAMNMYEKQMIPTLSTMDNSFVDHFKSDFSASATETTAEVKVGMDHACNHMSMDFVPAVRLLFWPHQATSWITRQRLWPSQDTIQSIVDKGCQVVPRTSPGGDVHSEWRLSFSGPEAILSQLRSNKQQQTYYFFKMFFYRYLKCVESSEPESKPLYSFVMKTTMLWVSEELPPDDAIWESLENSVQMLLFKLLGSLEAGFLPHYFIPEINLLDRVGEDVRSKCAAIISGWQDNILMSALFDMAEKLKFIGSMGAAMSGSEEDIKGEMDPFLQDFVVKVMH